MRMIFSFLFLSFFVVSCTPEAEKAKMDLNVRLMGNPQCKNLKSAGSYFGVNDSQSCIEFRFDEETQLLLLQHLNAGFNCCPESLWCNITYRNDTIFIQEFELSMGCKCNCLYDIVMEVDGIEPGNYQLKLIEPYARTQEQLCFELNLQKQNQGSYCVSREIYPWGQQE